MFTQISTEVLSNSATQAFGPVAGWVIAALILIIVALIYWLIRLDDKLNKYNENKEIEEEKIRQHYQIIIDRKDDEIKQLNRESREYAERMITTLSSISSELKNFNELRNAVDNLGRQLAEKASCKYPNN